jgi:hypothetical protein
MDKIDVDQEKERHKAFVNAIIVLSSSRTTSGYERGAEFHGYS